MFSLYGHQEDLVGLNTRLNVEEQPAGGAAAVEVEAEAVCSIQKCVQRDLVNRSSCTSQIGITARR